jgi:MFS family permease
MSGDPTHIPNVAEHTRSTIALCLSVFTVSYMLISVFPYSGFMAIHLLPDKLNEENAGLYAGLIASSFMVGRAFSSYAWGKAADIYGRVTCLTVSLLLSSLLSLAFGMSNTFGMALWWRFCLGFANGILPISKTMVSEIAGGDKNLETRGMGLVMGMWGWGFLMSPAISGAIAEPLRQYPDVRWLQDEHRWYYGVLEKFPFLLPNLVGAVMGVIAVVAVNLYVAETLPKQMVRPLHQIPSSIWHSFKRVLSVIPEEDFASSEVTPIAKSNKQKAYGAHRNEDYDSDEEDLKNLEALFDLMGKDVEGAVHESQSAYDESVLMLSTTPNSTQSITEAVRRRSSVSTQQRRASRLSAGSSSFSSQAPEPATMAYLWAQTSTRNHMILYWVSSFVNVSVDEGFPLFCISKAAGLGLAEKSIGKILSASGLIFAIAQYMVYALLVQWFGLYGSIRIGSIIMGPMVALIPAALWLNRSNGNAGDEDTDHLTISAFVFLW